MTTKKMLTIIIPTYNRASLLELLLNSLCQELSGLEGVIDVVIGDNASTDNTGTIINDFARKYKSTKIKTHEKNVGPDENFCRCIEISNSDFIWIISDDDLPKIGVIRLIIQELKNHKPDLLYIKSEWLSRITDISNGSQVRTVKTDVLSNLQFAKEVNVWVTFISGMIVNFQRLKELNPEIDIRRYAGTNLVQLGWVLPLLMSGNRFCIISQRCILATADNTGGYKLFFVFGTNFPLIVHDICGNDIKMKDVFLQNLVWNYLPPLIWRSRTSELSKFVAESPVESLKPLKRKLAYWILLYPMTNFPKPIAYLLFFIARSCTYLEILVRKISKVSYFKLIGS